MVGLDALLITAIDEPFGRTLIEAMDLGVPVVATASGGNTEAIIDNQTGFLVPPDTPLAFAEPVARLISEPDLRTKITANACAAVQHGFGTERHVTRVCEIYRSVLNQQPAAINYA